MESSGTQAAICGDKQQYLAGSGISEGVRRETLWEVPSSYHPQDSSVVDHRCLGNPTRTASQES